MSEKTHCDRCDVLIDVTDPRNGGAFIDLSPEGFDLCRVCIIAFVAWVGEKVGGGA